LRECWEGLGGYGSGLGMGGGYWEEAGLCGDCIKDARRFGLEFCELLTARPCVKEAQESENAQGVNAQGVKRKWEQSGRLQLVWVSNGTGRHNSKERCHLREGL